VGGTKANASTLAGRWSPLAYHATVQVLANVIDITPKPDKGKRRA
jgi:hypothetical protein